MRNISRRGWVWIGGIGLCLLFWSFLGAALLKSCAPPQPIADATTYIVPQRFHTSALGDTTAAKALQLSFQLGAAYGMFATIELQRRGQRQVSLSEVWALADSLRAAGWRPK